MLVLVLVHGVVGEVFCTCGRQPDAVARRNFPIAVPDQGQAGPPPHATPDPHPSGSTPARNGSTPTTLRTRTGSIRIIRRRSPGSSHG